MHIYDLLDIDELREAIDNKHVREQYHPTEPLAILNYSDLCAFSGVDAWNETTLQCRGLIYNTTDGEVVARPFPKFFNYGQDGADKFTMDEPVIVTDKCDGSLGICYQRPSGGWAIATRGSFTSEQAIHATDVLNNWHRWIPQDPTETVLFEIIYPENRIVLDYGRMDDLILLGAVDIEYGWQAPPEVTREAQRWQGPVAKTFVYSTLSDALSAPPRNNAEGFVISSNENRLAGAETRRMVKLKFPAYVALHRTLTHTSARTLWEFMAVNACKGLIKQAKHWGSYLGIDPARAVEILAVEGDWKAAVLDGVPDEFFAWVSSVIARINDEVADRIARGLRKVIEVGAIVGYDALAAYRMFESDPLDKELMRVYRGGSNDGLTLKAWRLATPGVELPFARTEEAA
jgi:RNA ligase